MIYKLIGWTLGIIAATPVVIVGLFWVLVHYIQWPIFVATQLLGYANWDSDTQSAYLVGVGLITIVSLLAMASIFISGIENNYED